MKYFVGALILLSLTLFSCDTFIEEPQHLKYPLREITVLEGEPGYTIERIIADPGPSTGEDFYILYSGWVDSGDSSQGSLFFSYWTGTELQNFTIDLPDAAVEDFIPLPNAKEFILLIGEYDPDIDATFSKITVYKEEAGGFVRAGEYAIDPTDFPSIPDTEDLRPSTYSYHAGRLYLTATLGGFLYDVSYKVDTGGISGPRESFSAFADSDAIANDFFAPATGGETFWGGDSIGMWESFHNPDTGISFYKASQQPSIGEYDYREEGEVMFLLTYDGTEVTGEQVTLKSRESEQIMNGSGELVVEQRLPTNSGHELLRISYTTSGLSEIGTFDLLPSGNSDWQYWDSMSIDGEDFLVLSKSIDDDGKTKYIMYGLPVSFLREQE